MTSDSVRTIRRGLALLAVLVLPMGAAQLFEAVEPHMGTLFRIQVYAEDKQTAEAGFKAAFDRIEELNGILSDYKPDSELNLASRAAFLRRTDISNDLARVIAASQRISAASNGAFDITVGTLTKLWRKARKERCVPSFEAISQAREKCGFRQLHVDENARTLKLDTAGVQLDVGGIAKGYAADEGLLILRGMGLRSALVAASGDLAIGDAPPGQAGWKIGIDSLDRADKPFTRVLLIANRAVSTSGSTEQYLEVGGKRYSHIIDPKTGMGLVTDIAVTTVSESGMTADAAATAVSVLGSEKGLAFVEKTDGLAAFILEKSGGELHALESERFKRLLIGQVKR